MLQSRNHICKLPSELQAMILRMLLDDYDRRAHRRFRQPYVKDLLNASMTCHQLRQTALGFKAIWALIIDIDCSSVDWLKLLVQRSHPLPITIASGFVSPNQDSRFIPRNWDVIFKERSRIEVVDIWDYSSRDNISCLETLLKEPTPNLRTFSVTRDEITEHNELDIQNLGSYISFGAKLRSLVIHNTNFFPYNMQNFNLTCLEIIDTGGDNEAALKLSTSDWLALLSHQRSLEKLVLCDMHESDPGQLLDRTMDQVSLPYLRIFKYEALSDNSVKSCGDLFGRLILPASCDVELSAYHSDSIYTDAIGGIEQGAERFLQSWVVNLGPEFRFEWHILIKLDCIEFTITPVHHSPKVLTTVTIPSFKFRYCKPISVKSQEEEDQIISFSSALFELFKRAGSSLERRSTSLILEIQEDGLEGPFSEREGVFLPPLLSFLSFFNSVSDIRLCGSELSFIIDHILYRGPSATSHTSSNSYMLFPNAQRIQSMYDLDRDRRSVETKVNKYLEWQNGQVKPNSRSLEIDCLLDC